MNIENVGKEAPTVINAKGGKISKSNYRFDLAPAGAMFKMCKVLDEGARKYGDDNWRLVPLQEHINHALIHLYAYLAGNMEDEHLTHALCRVMFAVDLEANPIPRSLLFLRRMKRRLAQGVKTTIRRFKRL